MIEEFLEDKTMKLKFLCLFLVLLALMLSSCSGADEPQEHPISPAVNILAEDNFMALSALKGEGKEDLWKTVFRYVKI